MGSCWHAHAGTEVGWDEAVLYVGVGSYLRPTCPRASVDQQLPPFLASLTEQQVRVLLVDPQFVDGELPLALRLDPAGWGVWRPDLGQWDSLPTLRAARHNHQPWRTYKKGRLLLGVLPGCVEHDAPTGRRDDDDGAWRRPAGTAAVEASSLMGCLYAHARAVLKRGGWVYLGIYCQPYYANEDNLAALDLYHALLDDYRSAKEAVDHGEERVCRLQGLVLADYADEERGTRVWRLNGRRHDQDLAVMKEVARFRGVGLNVSVPEYRYMHRQYGLGERFSEEEEKDEGEGEGEGLLVRTQAAIELAVERAGGREHVLAIDETDLRHLPHKHN